MSEVTRRRFLARVAAAGAALLVPQRMAWAGSAIGPHPTPRPGITGAKVLTGEHLAHDPDLIPLFDGVRQIPEIVDGIRCNCGCASQPGNYSLLSCYEGEEAMAKWCHICQGQGRVAVRLHKAGKSLDDIRIAIDAQFG